MFDNYYVDGEAESQEWIVAHRDYLEEGLRQDMRDHGYIPVLDIPATITWQYKAATDTFKFQMTGKGKRVGRKRAMKSMGIMSEEGLEIGEGLKLAIA